MKTRKILVTLTGSKLDESELDGIFEEVRCTVADETCDKNIAYEVELLPEEQNTPYIEGWPPCIRYRDLDEANCDRQPLH